MINAPVNESACPIPDQSCLFDLSLASALLKDWQTRPVSFFYPQWMQEACQGGCHDYLNKSDYTRILNKSHPFINYFLLTNVKGGT
jgi:hypothetical protein